MFDTRWVAAGTPGAAGRSGLGPLFNAASCEECHHGTGHGQGPIGDGPVPVALVIKLESRPATERHDPTGDPVYGRVFNTAAIEGVSAEGAVSVRYREISGSYYPGGGYWKIREPAYRLDPLRYGPLQSTTVIKPRLAPSLYGLGLLESVPETVIRNAAPETGPTIRTRGEAPQSQPDRSRTPGRFGWQGDSRSVREQTAKAFALEMGLTSTERPSDDCTSTQLDCLRSPNAGTPEVPEASFESVVAFVELLGVPESPVHPSSDAVGPRLFHALGCDGCHRPRLSANVPDAGGRRLVAVIAPYADLRLHDLGPRMADRDLSGKAVPSKWRTAPLWGLGYRLATERHPTFLHDGRARSTEEAVLWHLGEGAVSQRRFRELSPGRREQLLQWLETL